MLKGPHGELSQCSHYTQHVTRSSMMDSTGDLHSTGNVLIASVFSGRATMINLSAGEFPECAHSMTLLRFILAVSLP